MNTLLIIGHTFPEPTTTAAGSRMMQLISLFSEIGYHICFATTAGTSERSVNLDRPGISIEHITLNDSGFNEFISKLKPSIVIFDRYITEEQFGWRVTETVPEALRILDTEDLHFLRKAREEAVKKGASYDKAYQFTKIAKREIASILRCDLSLIISEFEMELLQDKFSVSPKILHYLPFLVEKPSVMGKNLPKYEERRDFVTIGNLLHSPNVDSILYLKREIWPLIKADLPHASIHVYGAYASQQVSELHSGKEGFLIKGWTESVSEVMKNARVCLAPIRFGAGLKGKLLDAMLNGTPSVTTKVGAEGINGTLPFAGRIADSAPTFAQASVSLYNEENIWCEAQQNGFRIVNDRFQKKDFSEVLIKRIVTLSAQLNTHREQNFIGAILQHHTLQSTKFLSRWIELKNKS